MLTRYCDWAPTGFDTKGLCGEINPDWYVAPVVLTRDSDVRSGSNFAALAAIAEKDGIRHVVHRFGHWACGWLEILLIAPEHAGWLEGWVESLLDYPIVSSGALAAAEEESRFIAWANVLLDERMTLCVEAGVSFLAARRDCPPHEVDLGDPLTYHGVGYWTP